VVRPGQGEVREVRQVDFVPTVCKVSSLFSHRAVRGVKPLARELIWGGKHFLSQPRTTETRPLHNE